MDFNFDNSINSSSNVPAKAPDAEKPTFKKLEHSIFNRFFKDNEVEMQRADRNSDGQISTLEVKNWIQAVIEPFGNLYDAIISESKDTTMIILKKLASHLGIIYDGPNPDAETFRKDILDELNNYQKMDFNKDNAVSLDELEYANKVLPDSVTATRNNINTRIDGVIENIQGSKSSCWLLSTIKGIAQTDPALYNEIIKQDENGNVTVTIKGASGGPFVYEISKEQLSKARYDAMNAIRNKGVANHEDNRYSTDPDAIAFEMAFEALEKKEAQETLAIVQNYIQNSSLQKPEAYQGIPLNEILSMSDEELNKIASDGNLSSYISITEPTDPAIKKPGLRNEYSSKAEYIKAVTNYILNTEQTIDKSKLMDENAILDNTIRVYSEKLKKYVNTTNPAHELIKRYIEFSKGSEGIEKPDMRKIDNRTTARLSIEDGGMQGADIKVLLGADTHIESFSNSDTKDAKHALNNYRKSSNLQMIYFNFKQGLEGFTAEHRLLIENIETRGTTKYIVYTDPHNSSEKKYLELNDFLNKFENMTLSEFSKNV